MEREFEVIRPFAAVTPISGAQKHFERGDIIVCNPAQSGPTITLHKAGNFYIVERSLFKACCKTRNQGA